MNILVLTRIDKTVIYIYIYIYIYMYIYIYTLLLQHVQQRIYIETRIMDAFCNYFRRLNLSLLHVNLLLAHVIKSVDRFILVNSARER